MTTPGVDAAAVRQKVKLVLEEVADNPDIPDDSPLLDAGVTSLASVEFRGRLEGTFGLPQLSATLLFDFPNLSALTDHLVDQLGGAQKVEEVEVEDEEDEMEEVEDRGGRVTRAPPEARGIGAEAICMRAQDEGFLKSAKVLSGLDSLHTVLDLQTLSLAFEMDVFNLALDLTTHGCLQLCSSHPARGEDLSLRRVGRSPFWLPGTQLLPSSSMPSMVSCCLPVRLNPVGAPQTLTPAVQAMMRTLRAQGWRAPRAEAVEPSPALWHYRRRTADGATASIAVELLQAGLQPGIFIAERPAERLLATGSWQPRWEPWPPRISHHLTFALSALRQGQGHQGSAVMALSKGTLLSLLCFRPSMLRAKSTSRFLIAQRLPAGLLSRLLSTSSASVHFPQSLQLCEVQQLQRPYAVKLERQVCPKPGAGTKPAACLRR